MPDIPSLIRYCKAYAKPSLAQKLPSRIEIPSAMLLDDVAGNRHTVAFKSVTPQAWLAHCRPYWRLPIEGGAQARRYRTQKYWIVLP